MNVVGAFEVIDIHHLDRLDSQNVTGRIGGEELLVLIPKTDASASKVQIEQVMWHLRSAQREISSKWRVSFSTGLVQAVVGETIDCLLTRADNALYLAKQLGRDRIEVGGLAAVA